MSTERSGLEKAAALCRARETAWRELARRGGSEFHTEEIALVRAWEAMTCAEMIEDMAQQAGR